MTSTTTMALFEPIARASAADRQAAARLVRDRISDPASWPEHNYCPSIGRITSAEPGWQPLADQLVAALNLLGLSWFDADTFKHHNGRNCSAVACARASLLAAEVRNGVA